MTDDVAGKCEGIKQWPLTLENIKRLSISVDVKKLVHYDRFLHALPVLIIVVAFGLIYIQHKIEQKIEEKEHERRTKRENMVKLKNYFKKQEDKFDKIGYLGDMFKLMQEHLDKIRELIDQNERMVAELDDPNIRKKLKQKHSVHDKLDKEGKLKQIDKLKSDVYEMLENMRAPDGRTLMEIYK